MYDSTQFLGAGAGVLTSFLWVLTSLFFAAAGRRIGVTAVNVLRIVLAIVLLAGAHLWRFGDLVPDVASNTQIVYLALSGLIGLALCDQALFTAFLDIGPRRALLCMTASPIFAAILGEFVLGETIPWIGYAGIAIAIAGIAVVVTQRSAADRSDASGVNSPRPSRIRRGYILALLAAFSQAAGGMFSKWGMGVGIVEPGQEMDPMAATLVRMVFGLFGMAPIVLVHLWMIRNRRSEAEIRGERISGMALTACGAVVGPFLGVWMSLVAFRYIEIAAAQTLASLSPVFILPFAHFMLKDRVGPRAITGAFVALGGAAILAFAPQLAANLSGAGL
ncbi:MAG: DMT family transporter [Planctomycetota bacterium]